MKFGRKVEKYWFMQSQSKREQTAELKPTETEEEKIPDDYLLPGLGLKRPMPKHIHSGGCRCGGLNHQVIRGKSAKRLLFGEE